MIATRRHLRWFGWGRGGLVRFLAVAGALVAVGLSPGAQTRPASSPAESQAAAALREQQHWLEARAAYDKTLEAESDWRSPAVRKAVEGAVDCSLKLQQWDDAISRAEQFVARTKGSVEEAIGERFLAGLYMSVPHYGTKTGTTYLRGQHTQGVYVSSWRKDRRESIKHYERSRELLLTLWGQLGTEGNPDTSERRRAIEAERIAVDFDLAAVLARRDEHRYGPWGWLDWWWDYGWAEEEESEAVDEADYEEPRWWGYYQEPQTPTGIPVGPDGRPQFLATPKEYSTQLGDGLKVRFLLDEIQRVDTSESRDDAARALMRRAMVARSLYGPELTNQWRGTQVQYDRFGRPLPGQPKTDEPAKKLWELEDDEAITIVGGRLRLISLPASESPITLLRLLDETYPKSGVRVDTQYALALYYQTRQQFPQAVREYKKLIDLYPESKQAKIARDQIARIGQPGIMLGATGIQLPGQHPKLSFSFRNTDKIEFVATAIDLAKYVQDRFEDTKEYWGSPENLSYQLFEKDRYKAYLGKEVARWSETVPRPEGNRAGEGSTQVPLTEPGACIVEAASPGAEAPSRVLLLISDIAIVKKNQTNKGLIYVADARTGLPLAAKAVRIYEHWQENNPATQKYEHRSDSVVRTTDEDGVIVYRRRHTGNNISPGPVEAIVTGEGGRMAFSFFQNWQEWDPGSHWLQEGERYYTITDRPVYRPGSTVRFRVWVRRMHSRTYQPAEVDRNVQVQVYDAKNNQVQTLTLKTDRFGCVSGEYKLGDEPPLGVYHLVVDGRLPDARQHAGGLFRVEEYKKPEFEVTVKPAKTQARLGEKVKARIEGRYYFGAPVVGGSVTYKVYRENYNHVYWGPGEYDWLYGKGYGRYYYAYPWLPWWGRWGCFICWDGWWPSPYWGFRPYHFPWGYYGDMGGDWSRRYESGTRKALRDLVAQGTAQLAEDGSYEIEIDTSRAKEELGDRDHRYTVEAEVRDQSRRTIEGQGSVIVTRQAFYAFVETDGGWYRPQNEAFVEVRALTPDNVPVATKGEVIVYRIRYGGADNREVIEEVVKRWNAETDAEGRLSFKYPIPGEGQYRITFKAQDSWGQEVLGNAVFWVSGPKFDGRLYRFNDLEIIADKRTYQVGETAHLLVNVAENNSRILFSDDVAHGVLQRYRFIDIPSRSTVIDIPVEDWHVPNFFVEATLVRNGRIHMEGRELFVPPVKGLLNVAIKPDKPQYKPGEKGKVAVQVTDGTGEPVQGQVTLTTYDEAVTYIQDEFGPNPSIFFYGQKRYHEPFVEGSPNAQFNPSGIWRQPEHEAYYQAQRPEGWDGWWGVGPAGLMMQRGAGYGGMGAREPAGFSFSAGMDSRAALTDSISMAESSSVHSMSIDGAMMRSGGMGGDYLLIGGPGRPVGESGLVQPEIRSYFADTAVWLPDVKLDDHGQATAEVTFPQSLTTWRIRGYALTNATQVGDATAKAVTTKNLLVRLQSPRFFIERDEVVLSANVHNYLKADKEVSAELILPAALLSPLGDAQGAGKPDEEGNVHLKAQAVVKAGAEHRFDWPVKAMKEGLATITVKAMTDEESDGMRMAFPVLVHGINKTVAQSGSYRVADDGSRTLKIDLPEQIDPEQTRLEITLSPSLAGVMIDALPYLVGYPYGCVEQTMSRFYPCVIVRDALKKMGTDLETIGKQRKQMNAGDLKNRFGHYDSPVFDSAELDRMVQAGLQRLYTFQRSDGGWGWWREDDSSPYQTSYVLQGLHAARQAGVNVDGGVYERGFQFLANAISKELTKPKDEQRIGDRQTQAYIAYILSQNNRLESDDMKKWVDQLYTSRGELNNYGRALLALAMHNSRKSDKAQTLLRNILQFVERDDSNDTAWVRTPDTYWWFWWNNDIETNAWTLKAMVAIDPKNELGPRLVKWLLNNRRNGYYWRSTRDTAQTIAAMVDFMRATGESNPEYALTVNVDGRPMKEVTVTKTNFFTFDNRVLLYGLQLKPGPHEVTIAKNGPGALYYSCYLSYFTKEDEIKGAGNEIFVKREYFKLVPKTEQVHLPDAGAAKTPPANRPQPLSATGRTETRSGWTRVPLKLGDTVTSGDQIEVVLKITSKNVYDYLVFEDMKPAGCEPVELRSGGRWAGGLCANLELRDEKVVFFIGLLEQGEHVLRYKMRAETPGTFHALPRAGGFLGLSVSKPSRRYSHVKFKLSRQVPPA